MNFLIKLYRCSKQKFNSLRQPSCPSPVLLTEHLYTGLETMNEITLKIPYTVEDNSIILKYLNKYTNGKKCAYNLWFENRGLLAKDIEEFLKSLNNVCHESILRRSIRYDVKAMLDAGDEHFKALNEKRKKDKLPQRQYQRKVCFGGKDLYTSYVRGNISKEELKLKRLHPLYCVGEANRFGNRLFQIEDVNKILFKPNSKEHVHLNIKYRNKELLRRLKELQDTKDIAITYKLDLEYIYMSFDYTKASDFYEYIPKENRVFAIDMNPNYIGYSVVEWYDEMSYKIIDSGVISIEYLNKLDKELDGKGFNSSSNERKYIVNKRNYEVLHIGKFLVEKAKHFKCEIFAYENLKFDDRNDKPKAWSRLCKNQWNRNKLIEQIDKYCKLNKIKVKRVIANFSSFVGNLVFRNENLPDMCLAAIEIGRRGYELNLQYSKEKKKVKKNIVFPDVEFVRTRIVQALEALNCHEDFGSLRELYYLLKNLKCKYRVSLDSIESEVFRLFNQKSCINLYNFR